MAAGTLTISYNERGPQVMKEVFASQFNALVASLVLFSTSGSYTLYINGNRKVIEKSDICSVTFDHPGGVCETVDLPAATV